MRHILITISFLFLSILTMGQKSLDTAKIRTEINNVLKKYGLKGAQFLFKVNTYNQKGGQTAFEINNYNNKSSHIVKGNNYGINGNVINGIQQRKLTKEVLDNIVSNLPTDKNSAIVFLISGGKEGMNYADEIYNVLLKLGYKNINSMNWIDPNEYDKAYVYKNDTVTEIRICPASNVQ